MNTESGKPTIVGLFTNSKKTALSSVRRKSGYEGIHSDGSDLTV